MTLFATMSRAAFPKGKAARCLRGKLLEGDFLFARVVT